MAQKLSNMIKALLLSKSGYEPIFY